MKSHQRPPLKFISPTKEDAAPGKGVASSFCSTKNKHFRSSCPGPGSNSHQWQSCSNYPISSTEVQLYEFIAAAQCGIKQTILVGLHAPRPPPFSDFCLPQTSETEENVLNTRYFRLKDPKCEPEEIEWIEMTGREFYRFIHSPEGRGRHFIDMDDVVLEATENETRKYKSEKNHHYYIQTQEEGWSTVSLYAIEDKNGCSGEEIVRDDTQDVEIEAIMRTETAALQKALNQLDSESYRLIHSLYLADTRKTLRQLSQSTGIPVMTLQDRKKRILAWLEQKL